MRWIMIVVGVLLVPVGVVLTLQGVGVLRGSPMTGDPFWATVGLLALLGSLMLLYVGVRRRAPGPRS
jgi:hypothetical protein